MLLPVRVRGKRYKGLRGGYKILSAFFSGLDYLCSRISKPLHLISVTRAFLRRNKIN